MRATDLIMLATLNEGKVEEYQALFKQYPTFRLRPMTEFVFNVHAMQNAEDANTYYDNAFSKGRLVHLAAKYPTISDDTGLEVDALGGRPGIFSNRYAQALPGETQATANTRKLLEELKGVSKDKRAARFVCTVVFFVEGLTLTATETLQGSILESPRGAQGFGYDAIFLVAGTDQSLAEMTLDEKNRISHRAKALRALMAQIQEKKIALVRP